MNTIEVKVPSIGDYKDVPVIDVLVKPGDTVAAEDGLVTLESDKATMDVPSPAAGTVKEVRVKVGDRVSEGSVVLTIEAAEAAAGKGNGAQAKGDGAQAKGAGASPSSPSVRPEREAESKGEGAAPRAAKPKPSAESKGEGAAPPPARPERSGAESKGGTLEVKVPSIGDYKDVPVIDVLVKAGDTVAADDGLVTLESDKATMDVPSPAAGKVKELRVKAGDRVSEGAVVLLLETAGAQDGAPARPERSEAESKGGQAQARGAPERGEAEPKPSSVRPERGEAESKGEAGAARDKGPTQDRAPARGEATSAAVASPPGPTGGARAHASPTVRKLARELGVELTRVTGSGPKGRIVHADVQSFVKEVMSATPVAARGGGGGGVGLDLPAWPKVDFAKFGPVERRPLTRIQKLSGPALARNWVMIPHVTQFDEADITDLEAFRVKLNEEGAKTGAKVTLLAFLVKACVSALRRFPEVNASLDGDNLVLKRYFHIGFAADTPNGLVVPVIRNADQKGVFEVAKELGELAAKARDGKLQGADIQGGTFSISSLGGIGGTAFTPIINAPEVAILGVSRSTTKPVWDGHAFAPRLVLPLSLSYDHRVVDGALAARFTSFLAQVLADMRRAML
ncbi:MAG: dihydrolipoyllysine-residue acetyltransferase [Anaeromyxobacteraceae bacterium]